VKPKSNYRHLQVARGPTKYCGRVTSYAEVIRVNATAPLLPACRLYVQEEGTCTNCGGKDFHR